MDALELALIRVRKDALEENPDEDKHKEAAAHAHVMTHHAFQLGTPEAHKAAADAHRAVADMHDAMSKDPDDDGDDDGYMGEGDDA